MEISSQTGCSHTNLGILEVVTGRETDVPSITQANITTHVKRLCKLVWIAHGLLVEFLSSSILTHRNTISKGQRPRHLECHITVGVGLCFTTATLLGSRFTLLDIIIHVAFYVGIHTFIVIIALPVLQELQ